MKNFPSGKVIFTMFIIAILIIGAIGFIDIPKAKQGDVNELISYLDSMIPEYMKNHNIGAVAIGFIHEGNVVFMKGYGYQDAEQTLPATENTTFQVASISKVFTAWGIMDLVEEGKLGLDQPIAIYLPDWQFPSSDFDENEVTIRRMLSHSSGIAHVGGYAGVETAKELQPLSESLMGANDANGEAVRIVYEPGSKYVYSGGAFTLLQYAIEEQTGLPFEVYMQENVFDPLQMNQTSFVQAPDMYENLSVVYDNKGVLAPSRYFTSQAAAGLYTTVYDLSKWVLAMTSPYNENTENPVLDDETLRIMYLPQDEPESLLPFGLGYMLQEIGPEKCMEVSHTGDNSPNWFSLVATLPQKGEGLIVLSNSASGLMLRAKLHSDWLIWECGHDSLGNRIFRMLYAALYVLPVFIICTVFILIWGKFRKH